MPQLYDDPADVPSTNSGPKPAVAKNNDKPYDNEAEWVPATKFDATQAIVTTAFPNKSPDAILNMTYEAFRRNVASDMIVQAGGLKSIFSKVSPASVAQSPAAVGFAATQNDAILAQVASENSDFFHNIYGSEAATPIIETFLDPNPARRAKTQDIIRRIAGLPVDTNWMANPGQSSITEAMAQDIADNVVAAPDPIEAFKALPVQEQRAIHFLFASMLATSEPVTGSLERATTVLKKNNYSLVLNPDDVKNVTNIINWSQGSTGVLKNVESGTFDNLEDWQDYFKRRLADAGHHNLDEAALNRMVGIEQFRAIGPDGVLVIDQEWAQAHPDKAVGLKVFLEQEFPDVQLQVGKDGIAGTFIDTWGRVTDKVTAPIPAVFREISEVVEAFDFGPFQDDTKRNEAELEKLKELRDSGTVPFNKQAQLNTDIYNLEEDLTHDIGWQAYNDFKDEALRGTSPGVGFGQVTAQSMGLNPGDNGYEAVVGTAAVAQQLFLDPTNIVFGYTKALSLAKYTNKTASTVEELQSVESLVKAIKAVDKRAATSRQASGVASALKAQKGVTGRLLRFVDKVAGYRPLKDEDILFIANKIHDRQVEQLKQFGGYLMQDVGGPIVTAFYRSLAKTPEAMAVSRPFRRQWQFLSDVLFEGGKNEDRFISIASRTFGRSRAVELAKAESPADLEALLVSGMSGRGEIGLGYSSATDRLLLESNSIRKEIARSKNLGKKVDELETQVDDLSKIARRTPEQEAELTKLEDRLVRNTDARDIYAERKLDLRARQVQIQDMLKGGGDYEVPKTIATTKDIKELKRYYKEYTEWEQIAEDGFKAGEDYSPAQWMTYKKAFQNMGFGHALKWEGVGADASVQNMRNWMQHMGLHPRDIERELLPWINKSIDGNFPAQWEYFQKLWTYTWDHSNMPASAIQKMRTQYESYDGVRSAANINEGPSGSVPARFNKDNLDEAGNLKESVEKNPGKPIISTQELKQYEMKIPTMDQMFELRGFTRRHLEAWKEAGGVKKPIASSLQYMGQGYEWITELWKYMVLGPRLLGALPMRIFAEQQFRMAGYGWLVNLRHPSQLFEHFGFAAHTNLDEIRLFAESPTAALGGVVDNFAKWGRGVRQSDLLEPGNAGYESAVNHGLHEWLESPEFKLWIRDNMDDEDAWLAAMRGEGARIPMDKLPETMPVKDLEKGIAPEWELIGKNKGEASWETQAAGKPGTSGKSVGQLASEIKSDGIKTPLEIGIDPETGRYVIFEGHHRLAAAKQLGLDEVPVIWRKTLPEEIWARETAAADKLGRKIPVLKSEAPKYDPLRHALNEHWTKQWEADGWTAKEMVARTRKSLMDLIGTGEGANIIKSALRNGGKVNVNGSVVKIGNKEFADLLEGMRGANTWVPGTKAIPNLGMRWQPTDQNWLLNLRDFLFKWGYSNPDLAFSRSPLYRKIAKREFNNLMASGYSAERAAEVAKEVAAGKTADIMFEIGAHTTGEHFLKTFNPFFPAWRELVDTWLVRIPSSLGHAHEEAGLTRLLGWGVGQARLAHYANIAHDVGIETGFLAHDENGDLTIPVGFMGPVLNYLLGTDIDYKARIPLASIFGVFPIPLDLFSNDPSKSVAEKGFGFFPTLGAPGVWTLNLMEKMGAPFEFINEYVAPYGVDPSGGASNLDNLLRGTGFEPPWQNTAARVVSEQMKLSSISDGIRIFMRDNPIPGPYPEGWGDLAPEDRDAALAAYNSDVKAKWWDEAIAYGNNYARRAYLTKGFFGTFMPASLQWTDEGAADLAEMWRSLETFKDSGPLEDKITQSVIETFQAEHPELEAYWTGKYWDTRTSINPDESFSDWHQALSEGTDIKAKTPHDLLTIIWGQSTENFFNRRIEALEQEAINAKDPMLYALTNREYRERLSKLKDQKQLWLDYVSTDESRLDGAGENYGTLRDKMFAIAANRRGEDAITERNNGLSFKQERLLAFDGLRKEFDSYVALDPSSNDKYYKNIDKLYEQTAELFKSDDPMVRATGWFYEKVNGPYYEEYGALQDELLKSDNAHDPLIYNKLRNLAQRYDHPFTHAGMVFPSPQEYQFNLWTPEEQQQHVAHWAELNAEYLTEFQRKQVGYTLKPSQQKAANMLSDFAFKADQRYNKWLYDNGRTYDVEMQAKVDKAVATYADQLGLTQYWQEAKQPNYVRIGKALHLSETTPGWNTISSWATNLRYQIEIHDQNPGTATGSAQRQAYDWFINNVRNLKDEKLNKVLDNLAIALGERDQPLAPDDLLRSLFFDVYLP